MTHSSSSESKSTPTPSNVPATPVSALTPSDVQYVAPMELDNKLEPDAMRGSEQYLRQVEGLKNYDEERNALNSERTKSTKPAA